MSAAAAMAQTRAAAVLRKSKRKAEVQMAAGWGCFRRRHASTNSRCVASQWLTALSFDINHCNDGIDLNHAGFNTFQERQAWSAMCWRMTQS